MYFFTVKYSNNLIRAKIRQSLRKPKKDMQH
jgi:hypothetical protein